MTQLNKRTIVDVYATDLAYEPPDDYRADYPLDGKDLQGGYIFLSDDVEDAYKLHEWARQEMAETDLCMR